MAQLLRAPSGQPTEHDGVFDTASTAFQPNTHELRIRCPNCRTRFVLEGLQLEDADNPAFHCSRCDVVFTAAEAKKALRGTPKAAAALPAVPTQQSPLEIPKYWNPGTTTQPPRESEELEASTAPESAQLELRFNHRPLSVPTVATQPQSEQSPFGGSATAITSAVDPFANESAFDISDFGSVINAPLADNPEESSSQRAATTHQFSSAVATRNSRAHTAPSEQVAAHSIVASLLERGVHPLLLICAPLLIAVITLVTTAFVTTNNEAVANLALKTLPASAPQVAPSGVTLRNTRFRRLVLDSGETVRVISGEITNDSDRALRGVIIEGLLYDGAGNLVTETRINAGSTLAKTRIRSLTPEMVEQLQKEGARRPFVLRPGESEEFSMAIMGKDAAAARFYTARVYSVSGR